MSLFLLTGCGKEQTSSVKEEQPHEIAFTVGGTPEYAHGYDTMKEMAHASKFVIYGEVIDSICQAEEYFIFTYEKVRVDQVLYGDCEVGDTLYVRKMMGEVTLGEYIEGLKMLSSNAAEEYEEKYSKEEQETLYVQWDSSDDESEIGQKSIYFLDELGIPEEYNEYGAYCRINDTEGQYIELEDGTFENVRAYAEEKAYASRSSDTGIIEPGPFYTMDEMKDQIN